MYTETISLSSIDAVKKFVCIANEYDFTINLLSDKYKIDAKSIMSVFSLDLPHPSSHTFPGISEFCLSILHTPLALCPP